MNESVSPLFALRKKIRVPYHEDKYNINDLRQVNNVEIVQLCFESFQYIAESNLLY